MSLLNQNSPLLIPGPGGQIEASFAEADSEGVLADLGLMAVICHPHPVHGGTMDNKVVTTLMRTYRDIGVKTLRFNFRGVGRSGGVFDRGRGELDDLLAVIDWVSREYSHMGLVLAGFSFGSSIAAQGSHKLGHIHHLLLVAPPVERYSYDLDSAFPCPSCVVQGDKDELLVAEGVYTWIETLRSPVELLRYPDAGHYFHGFLSHLKKDLSQILVRQLTKPVRL